MRSLLYCCPSPPSPASPYQSWGGTCHCWLPWNAPRPRSVPCYSGGSVRSLAPASEDWRAAGGWITLPAAMSVATALNSSLFIIISCRLRGCVSLLHLSQRGLTRPFAPVFQVTENSNWHESRVPSFLLVPPARCFEAAVAAAQAYSQRQS